MVGLSAAAGCRRRKEEEERRKVRPGLPILSRVALVTAALKKWFYTVG